MWCPACWAWGTWWWAGGSPSPSWPCSSYSRCRPANTTLLCPHHEATSLVVSPPTQEMPRTFDSSLLYLYLGQAVHWTSSQVARLTGILTMITTLAATASTTSSFTTLTLSSSSSARPPGVRV